VRGFTPVTKNFGMVSLTDRSKDASCRRYFATPVMTMAMESAALNAIRAYLDPGESAIGTAVNVCHLAATPVGRLVTGKAEVAKVDGREAEFTVQATEGAKEDRGRRVVIDVARFVRRLGSAALSPTCCRQSGTGWVGSKEKRW
jgi:fluoroacetyl-CoA thioesterase